MPFKEQNGTSSTSFGKDLLFINLWFKIILYFKRFLLLISITIPDCPRSNSMVERIHIIKNLIF